MQVWSSAKAEHTAVPNSGLDCSLNRFRWDMGGFARLESCMMTGAMSDEHRQSHSDGGVVHPIIVEHGPSLWVPLWELQGSEPHVPALFLRDASVPSRLR